MANLQVTQVGLNAATSAEGLGLQLKLTRCRFGSGVNYTPAPDGSETDLHGTTVFTTAIASYKKDIATGVLELLVRLYPTDGTFTFGEFALDAEVSPGNFVTYATAALPALITKYNTPTSDVPSTFTFTFTLRLSPGDTTLIVVPGDVNAGGVDYSAQYSELNMRIGDFEGLASLTELQQTTPPQTKGVRASHLLSRSAGNRLSLRSDGIYLGDEAPPELSIVYVDAINGVDPVPATEYASDTAWLENPLKWQSLRGGPTTPMKTLAVALKCGPKGFLKTVMLKIWQVHRLTEPVHAYQSYEVNCYGDAPTNCVLDTSTGVISVIEPGLDPNCSIPLLAKDDSTYGGTPAVLTVGTSPRSVTITPDAGQTDVVLLYRNATGSLTRVHATKTNFDGSAASVWRYHQDTTPTAAEAYNTWAIANAQPVVSVISSPEAGWGTYIGQGPAVQQGSAFVSNHIAARANSLSWLSRSIGFVASEMHPTLDDSLSPGENRFQSVFFPEAQNYSALTYNMSYYGREAVYGDWDMPGLLTMPTAGRLRDSQLFYASGSYPSALGTVNMRGRAQTNAKKTLVFFESSISFTYTYSGSSQAGYVRDSGLTGYNIKDWLGLVVKSTNPVISMTTSIDPTLL